MHPSSLPGLEGVRMFRRMILLALLPLALGLSACSTFPLAEEPPAVAAELTEVDHSCELWETWDGEARACH